MVFVAHRLATVQNADVIFVIGEGNVVETGNHASLLRKRGIYYQMVRSIFYKSRIYQADYFLVPVTSS
jgi:ABC-type multidrug transport system fused ATPase/permease subunit